MTFGGLGIEGIAQTPFYRFISSAEGLSQLGIPSTEPPRLLQAYERTFKASSNNTTFLMRFGDVAMLKMATPHPSSGTGRLQVESWLEWIIDKETVGSGYVERNRLPGKVQRAIRLSSPLGGLMLPRGKYGSSGNWKFPPQFQDYDMKWLEANIKRIQDAIINQMAIFLTKRSK